MRVLFDQGTPLPLRQFLNPHFVQTAYELGWSELKNGELLSRADASGFDVFVTTDQNLRYQQNLPERTIAIVVLSTTSWPRIKASQSAVVSAVHNASAGSYTEVDVA
jgi:hypothetical protein